MENVAIDPLAGLATDLPEQTVRDHVAAIVKGGGTSLEAANAALVARGAAPLTANSREQAEASRAALLNDDAFRAKYVSGDPSAIAALFQADLKVQQSQGKLTDRPMTAADYNLQAAPHLPPGTPPANVQEYSDGLSNLAASIQLPKESAAALVEGHFNAVRETAAMSGDELAMYGDKQTAMLHSVLGPNAEAEIKSASETLSRISGRKLDLSAIVKSNGAEVALTLYHQAEVLARRK